MISCAEHPCFEVLGNPSIEFFPKIKSFLDSFKIDIRDKEIDHICYRVDTESSYNRIKGYLGNYGTVLVEGMIGGRPIATFLLHTPIVVCFDEKNGRICREIKCLELPSPKLGNKYLQGYEHIEIVIGAPESSCLNSRQELEKFAEGFPEIVFDFSAIDKEVNADVSITIDDNCSVKFHVTSLKEVIRFEKSNNLVQPVPIEYFREDK